MMSGRKRAFDIDGDGQITLNDFRAIFTGERHKESGAVDFLRERTAAVWKENEHHFTLLSIRIQQRERQVRGTLSKLFFSEKDRKLRKLVDTILNNIQDPILEKLQGEYSSISSQIRSVEGKISELDASSFMLNAAQDSKVARARGKYSEELDKKISQKNNIIEAFQLRFNKFEVQISEQQAEVLLSRIDAEDISRITSVFAVAHAIAQQLAQAKQISGENLEVTKKYYGIYIGLLEIQEEAQTRYIDKIEKIYLPGVRKIKDEAVTLRKSTSRILDNTEGKHREAYQRNISSQDITISVTDEYEKSLISNKDRIDSARQIVVNLRALAENTLSTVRVSSDLATLISQAEAMFDQVVSLQAPELAPFENLALQREFESVTEKLRAVEI